MVSVGLAESNYGQTYGQAITDTENLQVNWNARDLPCSNGSILLEEVTGVCCQETGYAPLIDMIRTPRT